MLVAVVMVIMVPAVFVVLTVVVVMMVMVTGGGGGVHGSIYDPMVVRMLVVVMEAMRWRWWCCSW